MDERAGGRARAARRDHRLPEIDPRRRDSPAELIRGKNRPIPCDEVLQRKIDAAGHVPAAKSRAWLGLCAGESSRRTEIHDLFRSARERVAHRGEIPHLCAVEPGMESSVRQRRPAGLKRAALAPPLEDATVQHGNTLMAEDTEHPPDSSGAQVDAGAVVNDEIVGIVEADAVICSAKSSEAGSMCGSGDDRSLAVSRSKKIAPGMWPAAYSAAGARPLVGRYHEASSTRRLGPPTRVASHSVVTSAGSGSVTESATPCRWSSALPALHAHPPHERVETPRRSSPSTCHRRPNRARPTRAERAPRESRCSGRCSGA